MAVTFIHSLYRGEEDKVLTEMITNCKAMTALQKLSYQSLNGDDFKERLLDQFKLDTHRPLPDCDAADDEKHREVVVDQELLERDRKLQELMSIKPIQRSKDMT